MRRTRYDEFLEMQAQDTDDCILWPYAKNQYGYGQVRRDGWAQLVHRLSCTMAHHGPLPSKPYALHSCHTPACFNPRHLRWGTQKENCADKVADGTANNGQRNGHAKLTDDDVRLIRYEVGRNTRQIDFARHFGVSPATIRDALTGRNWSWLPDHTPREVPRGN